MNNSQIGFRSGPDECQLLMTLSGARGFVQLLAQLEGRIPDHEHLATDAWAGSELAELVECGELTNVHMVTIVALVDTDGQRDMICAQVDRRQELHLYLSRSGLACLMGDIQALLVQENPPSVRCIHLPRAAETDLRFEEKANLSMVIVSEAEFVRQVVSSE